MSSVAIWLPVAVVAACAMEPWAALLHKRAWHTRLWSVHRSHHRPRPGRFEANDALSATHAPIAISLILYGCRGAPGPLRELAFGVGLGMSLFGVAYVMVHDGLVHGRLPVAGLARVSYLARVRDAHLLHHRPGAREPYGLFLGPLEVARAEGTHRPGPRARAAAPSDLRPQDPGRASPGRKPMAASVTSRGGSGRSRGRRARP